MDRSAAKLSDLNAEAVGLTEGSWSTIVGVAGTLLRGLEVRVFGSRLAGTARQFSDLDLAIYGGPVHPRVLREAREAFEFSRLPIRVDLIDVARASPAFLRAAGLVAAKGTPRKVQTTEPAIALSQAGGVEPRAPR